MRRTQKRSAQVVFYRPIFLWMCGLIGLCLITFLFSPEAHGRPWTFWEVAHLFLGWIVLFLPFVTFAGGLAIPAPTPSPAVAIRSLGIAATFFALSAYAEPMAEHRLREESGAYPSAEAEWGPRTPGAILAQRSAIRASPPESYSFSVDRPSEWPPNWLLLSFWSPFCLAISCVLAAFLGQLVAFLTNGLSPPSRVNTRWALGLLNAILSLSAFMIGDSWVRQDVSHSGVVGAWGPLLVPLLEIWVLVWLARRRVPVTNFSVPG